MRIFGRFQGEVEMRRFYPMDTVQAMAARPMQREWCFIGFSNKLPLRSSRMERQFDKKLKR